MATKIVTKNSSTASAVPTASDLVQGELAVNVADKKLFTEDNSGAIIELADGVKLAGIEASADVTDTANVTAAGALMDSELTSEASVKALNQGVATTDSPAFAGGTFTGEITANGGIALGDNDKATFGASDDLQIFHNGTESFIREVGEGGLKIDTNGPDLTLRVNATETALVATSNGAVTAYYDSAAKLATTSTGIDVTGTATMDGLTVNGTDARIYLTGVDTDINMDASANGQLHLDGSGYGFGIALNGDGAQLYTNSASRDLIFGVNETEVMRVTNGNVGIGTSSPSEELELASSSPTIRLTDTDDSTYGSVSYNVGALMLNGDNTIRCNTGGTERLRVDSSGNLLVGTTSTTPSTGGHALRRGANSYAFISHASSVGSGNYYIGFRHGTSNIGAIVQNGTTGILYNTSSDQRLKENIADADDAGSKIDAIQVRKYDWKADGSHQDYGMIAQELLEVAPEAVSVPEDSEEMMGVDYSKLVPMLIKEIQSLRNRVAQLEE